ncbi:MAG TPA: SEL1-like repeat protein [Allosphingosinicella sp.]|uniref:SEL1-like repeat protein n=1 Tax=Allosphingosinicella sp. TaxID=2823234 RepID=UPI002ED831D6
MRKYGLASLTLMLVPLSLSACAPDRLPGLRKLYSLPGISLEPGAADPQLQDLVRRVHRQDKYAQLELGIRYEEGRGVPVNLKLAEQLYGLAAMNTRGSYFAPGSKGAAAPPQFFVQAGGKGLPEAKRRLEALRARRK